MKNKIATSLHAAVVGDALGVPVEATPRDELSLCSVKNLLGYGRFDHPQGTWSDDTSMILCTLESFLQNGYDIEDLGQTFCRWIFDGHWTPGGYVFDSGLTTFLSLDKIRNGNCSARNSGGNTEEDNGNGSLMRILPVALFFCREQIPLFLKRIHEVSSITHAHPRALIGCGIYSLLVRELISTDDKMAAFRNAAEAAMNFYQSIPEFNSELSHYMRIFSLSIPNLVESEINSSGYIIDTLEASIWCFLKHDNSRDILLSAVKLGLDTDTTGAVAGGLAGLTHGTADIPESWLDSLARKDEIIALINRFAEKVASAA